ncbi:hypothetical protein P4O66_001044 [Electrophorus voltai]|uniref:Uncharacterized protein n=1 Tax=Electrophorus voltai TaxID=2609070 RepID=A0AAD8ZAR3_9TELE|nr:hypothetical protein P4O66_001044 [Electrophorus voltai]
MDRPREMRTRSGVIAPTKWGTSVMIANEFIFLYLTRSDNQAGKNFPHSNHPQRGKGPKARPAWTGPGPATPTPWQRSHLRCLRDFRLPSKVLRNVYTCTIESILTGNITVWLGNSTKRDRQALQRVVRSAERIIHTELPDLQTIYYKRCQTKARRIVKDPTNPNNRLFSLLSSPEKGEDFGLQLLGLRHVLTFVREPYCWFAGISNFLKHGRLKQALPCQHTIPWIPSLQKPALATFLWSLAYPPECKESAGEAQRFGFMWECGRERDRVEEQEVSAASQEIRSYLPPITSTGRQAAADTLLSNLPS